MARGEKNYLSNAQIKKIEKRVSSALAMETKNEIKNFTDLRKLNNELKRVGRIIEAQANIYYTDKKHSIEDFRSRYTTEKYITKTENGQKVTVGERDLARYFYQRKASIKKDEEKLKEALAEGYLLIMLLREKLLNEKIHYHIYIGNDFGDAQAVTLNDVELLKLMDFSSMDNKIKIGKKSIDDIKELIRQDKSDDLINKILEDMNKRTEAYRDFFSRIINSDFDTVVEKGQKAYKIKFSIVDNDDGLRDEVKLHLFKKGLKKEDLYNHQIRHRNAFNRGHLSEAFDIAYDSILRAYNYINMRPIFYENLYYDSIKATKGGDNSVLLAMQYSVKAFSANLYNVSTLYGDLIELTTMIDAVLNGEGVEGKAKAHFENMFVSQEKYKDHFGEVGDKAVQAIIYDSLGILENSKT